MRAVVRFGAIFLEPDPNFKGGLIGLGMTETLKGLTTPPPNRMKNPINLLILPLLGISSAFSGDVSTPTNTQTGLPLAASESKYSPYLGFSGVLGEQSIGGTEFDVDGVRVIGGLCLSDGFSIDGRYEFLGATDAAPIREIDSTEFRAILNYQKNVSDSFSLSGGIGYGWLDVEASPRFIGGSLTAEALLINVGIKYTSDRFWATCLYTHGFTNSEFNSGGWLELPQAANEDVGYIEATLGYNINESLSATLSLESQVLGDTLIEKEWLAGIGLLYKF